MSASTLRVEARAQGLAAAWRGEPKPTHKTRTFVVTYTRGPGRPQPQLREV